MRRFLLNGLFLLSRRASGAGAIDLDHRIAGAKALAFCRLFQRVHHGVILDFRHRAAHPADQELRGVVMMVVGFRAGDEGVQLLDAVDEFCSCKNSSAR